MIRIAIVFPVFNGLEYTKMCLKSLSENIQKTDPQKVKFEVVITDDGSTDGTEKWIRENYPHVNVLKGTGNLWWSGGINMAADFALNQLHADYTIWWNNDIIENRDYFKVAFRLVSEHDPATIIGSKIYMDESKSVIWSMGGRFNSKNGFKSMIGSMCRDGDDYQSEIECDWLTGMGTIIHRSVYEEIGMVDARNFPQYHGDSDFTFRAKNKGYRIIVSPELKIYNDTRNSGLIHRDSFSKLIRSLTSIKSNYNFSRDFMFYRKHTTSVKAYLFMFNKYFTYIGGFLKWKILALFGKKREEKLP
jgi:GT2 family glycosyltransferase